MHEKCEVFLCGAVSQGYNTLASELLRICSEIADVVIKIKESKLFK